MPVYNCRYPDPHPPGWTCRIGNLVIDRRATASSTSFRSHDIVGVRGRNDVGAAEFPDRLFVDAQREVPYLDDLPRVRHHERCDGRSLVLTI